MQLVCGISRSKKKESALHAPSEEGYPLCIGFFRNDATFEATEGDAPTCAKCLRILNPRPVGRPRKYAAPLVAVSVTVSQEQADFAAQLGGGNVSAGVQVALDRAKGVQ